MKLLVFGKTGQVASALQRCAPDAMFLGRHDADLADPSACARAIWAAQPEAVINAAAYTQVDSAETQEPQAHVVNAKAPGAMAQACADLEIPFVHLSTDYVFDGTQTHPARPDDPTNPCNAYGRTKLAGETLVRASGAPYAILRTSWVVSADGANFIKTMLRLADSHDELNIVEDQFGAPTPADAIANACVDVAAQLCGNRTKTGTYHFAGTPDTNWADFARHIFAQAGRSVSFNGIPSTAYPTPAKRPVNSRLNCDTLTQTFGIARPDWRDALPEILSQIGANT